MKYVRYKNITDTIVVALDMRSSSLILDDVVASKSVPQYIDFIAMLKHFLAEELQIARKIKVEPHKFSGDAWLLFFDIGTPGADILAGLRDLCDCYAREFDKRVRPILSELPERTGLAFGVDEGTLSELTIFAVAEYLSPAINVATRLQGAAKSLPSRFGTVISQRAYDKCFANAGFKAETMHSDLKGIKNGANFPCVAVDLFSPSDR